MIPLRDDNPTRGIPWLSWLIIGGCLLTFFWQISLPAAEAQYAIYAFGLIPARIFGLAQLTPELTLIPAWMTAVTSMFLHGGWLHLIGNLLYLWIFSDNVEDRLGTVRFAAFYLCCGVAAAAAQALPTPDSSIPMIGASGALSGVLGAYLVWFPRAHVLVLIPLGFFSQMLRLPAGLVLGLWFALQLLAELGGADAGVAFRAHIGGFVAGVLLALALSRR